MPTPRGRRLSRQGSRPRGLLSNPRLVQAHVRQAMGREPPPDDQVLGPTKKKRVDARSARSPRTKHDAHLFDSTATSSKTAARCSARLIDSEDNVAPLIASMSWPTLKPDLAERPRNWLRNASRRISLP